MLFRSDLAILLGLNPRIALALNLPSEHVTDVHMRIVPNLRQLIEQTRPEMLEDVEIFEKQRKQWEWQSLNGLDAYAPAIYLVESLYAKGDEIKYVPSSNIIKQKIEETIKELVTEFIKDEIEKHARNWLMDNLKPDLVQQLTSYLHSQIEAFTKKAEEELEKLNRMNENDLREAVKLKLVKNPKQYWTDALRKVITDILAQKFKITSDIDGTVEVQQVNAEQNVTISEPEVPPKPLEKIDIIEAVEKRITGKKTLIQKLRDAIQKVFGKPSEIW